MERVFVKIAFAWQSLVQICVGFVVGKQPHPIFVAIHLVASEPELLQRFVVGLHNIVFQSHRRPSRAAFVGTLPSPGVAKEQLRQHVQNLCLGSAIGDRQLDQQIIRPRFGVLGINVKVSRFVEDTCFGKFVFTIHAAALTADIDQFFVRELALGILVQAAHVTVRRRAI